MSGQQSKGNQRSRTHKISEGKRRSSNPVELTEVQKVNMGKGLFSTIKPVGQSSRFKRSRES